MTISKFDVMGVIFFGLAYFPLKFIYHFLRELTRNTPTTLNNLFFIFFIISSLLQIKASLIISVLLVYLVISIYYYCRFHN